LEQALKVKDFLIAGTLLLKNLNKSSGPVFYHLRPCQMGKTFFRKGPPFGGPAAGHARMLGGLRLRPWPKRPGIIPRIAPHCRLLMVCVFGRCMGPRL
jgi:hypothetical protein